MQRGVEAARVGRGEPRPDGRGDGGRAHRSSIAPCRGTRKKPSANSGANSAGGRASGTGPGTSSRSVDLLAGRAGTSAAPPSAGTSVELSHEIHDAVELVDQAVQVLVLDRELGQPGHVQHVVAPDAHALSHSRSRPGERDQQLLHADLLVVERHRHLEIRAGAGEPLDRPAAEPAMAHPFAFDVARACPGRALRSDGRTVATVGRSVVGPTRHRDRPTVARRPPPVRRGPRRGAHRRRRAPLVEDLGRAATRRNRDGMPGRSSPPRRRARAQVR